MHFIQALLNMMLAVVAGIWAVDATLAFFRPPELPGWWPQAVVAWAVLSFALDRLLHHKEALD